MKVHRFSFEFLFFVPYEEEDKIIRTDTKKEKKF